MRTTIPIVAFSLIAALSGCGGSSATPGAPSTLPPPSSAIPVPGGVTATSGYRLSVFAAPPSGSTKPDSVVQVGSNVFVAFGDDVNPDGTAGPDGKTQTEVVQYDLTGKQLKVYSVTGHNDGLMAFDANTLWAMSNEDANPQLVVINVSAGSQTTYAAQPSLLSGTALPHGGGLDDMMLINGKVYVSGSNPTTAAGPCPPASSTPGCPNGVSTGTFAYILSLNSSGSTFNLTPVASSGASAMNLATKTSAVLNMTDPDSEALAPDGSTLVVDSQGDSTLTFVANPASSTPTLSFLPVAASGMPVQLDDTRFAPNKPTFLLLTDTPTNTIYRIDGAFAGGGAYSAGPPGLFALDMISGNLSPIASGMNSPHGLAFITN